MSIAVTFLNAAAIDGVGLRRALQAGIHRFLSRQEHLNKINVFPVADGDTGTNIAFTLHAVRGGKAGGAFFGREPFVEKFHAFLSKRIDTSKRYRVSVSHCNCPDDANKLLELLRASIPHLEDAWLMPTGSALGVHAGPNTLVAGLQEYAPPEQRTS